MARQDRSLLKPSVYSVMVGIVYWVTWVFVFIAADVDFESGGGQLLGAAATFGSFLVFYFFMGMTVNMVDVHLKGGTPSLKDAFQDAKQNFIAIVFLALISTVVEMIAKAVRGSANDSDSVGGAIALRLIAGIIESIWTMMAFLLLPAIIIEDASLGDSLRRVREISKGHYLQIGIGEVGVRFVTGLIGFFVTLLVIAVVLFSFGTVGGTFGTVLGIGVGGTILCLYAAFASYLRMAYYTCLYVWAADLKDKGPSAPAPIPLARVLNR
jgi:hypothetical protein